MTLILDFEVNLNIGNEVRVDKGDFRKIERKTYFIEQNIVEYLLEEA
jgi:hypothetical protein